MASLLSYLFEQFPSRVLMESYLSIDDLHNLSLAIDHRDVLRSYERKIDRLSPRARRYHRVFSSIDRLVYECMRRSRASTFVACAEVDAPGYEILDFFGECPVLRRVIDDNFDDDDNDDATVGCGFDVLVRVYTDRPFGFRAPERLPERCSLRMHFTCDENVLRNWSKDRFLSLRIIGLVARKMYGNRSTAERRDCRRGFGAKWSVMLFEPDDQTSLPDYVAHGQRIRANPITVDTPKLFEYASRTESPCRLFNLRSNNYFVTTSTHPDVRLTDDLRQAYRRSQRGFRETRHEWGGIFETPMMIFAYYNVNDMLHKLADRVFRHGIVIEEDDALAFFYDLEYDHDTPIYEVSRRDEPDGTTSVAYLCSVHDDSSLERDLSPRQLMFVRRRDFFARRVATSMPAIAVDLDALNRLRCRFELV